MWRAETGHRLLSISGFDRNIRSEAHFRPFETTNIAVQFGSDWKGRLLDDQDVLEAARAAAAQYLRAQGYVREADMAAGVGREHRWTPVTNAHLGCRLLLEKNNNTN